MSEVKQKYANLDGNIFPFKLQEGLIIDAVPPAYYSLCKDMNGWFLRKDHDTVEVPEKIYGSAEPRSELILSSFDRKDEGVGVGLFGAKGAGKTLLANLTANKAIARGMPVIDVSKSFEPSQELFDFLNSIGDCLIIFDEFLKHLANFEDSDNNVNVRKLQGRMLTFFSGTNNAKRLTFLIDNESYKLNSYFVNRPSRMRYLFQYEHLEPEVIEALYKDYGFDDVEVLNDIIKYSVSHSCTFDMCNELLEEMQATGTSLTDVTQYLNVPTIVKAITIPAVVSNFVATHEDVTVDNAKIEFDPRNFRGEVSLLVKVPDDMPDDIEDEDDYYEYVDKNSSFLADYVDYSEYDSAKDGKIPYVCGFDAKCITRIHADGGITFNTNGFTFDVVPLPSADV